MIRLSKNWTIGDSGTHIGPAGENRVRFAPIFTSKARSGGKCGMGAVMGLRISRQWLCEAMGQ